MQWQIKISTLIMVRMWVWLAQMIYYLTERVSGTQLRWVWWTWKRQMIIIKVETCDLLRKPSSIDSTDECSFDISFQWSNHNTKWSSSEIGKYMSIVQNGIRIHGKCKGMNQRVNNYNVNVIKLPNVVWLCLYSSSACRSQSASRCHCWAKWGRVSHSEWERER